MHHYGKFWQQTNPPQLTVNSSNFSHLFLAGRKRLFKKYFYLKKIFFQKPLPGPSARIFVIAQKIELPKCWGGGCSPPPSPPGSYAYVARADPSQDHSRRPILRAAINRPPADWRRRAGRPRRTWLRTIELDLRPHNLGLNTAWIRAQNRSKWRQLVETAMLTDTRSPVGIYRAHHSTKMACS